MSQIWIERLASATSKVERDEILLRELTVVRDRQYVGKSDRHRVMYEIEEQMRALADLAFESRSSVL